MTLPLAPLDLVCSHFPCALSWVIEEAQRRDPTALAGVRRGVGGGGDMSDPLEQWNPPCWTCNDWWQVERNLSCRDCCDLFKAYRAAMAERNIEVVS